MDVIALTPDIVHSVHRRCGATISSEYAMALCSGGGFAAIDETGPFGIAGIYELRPGVGLAWTMLDRRWKRYARQITGLIEFHLSRSDFVRIEAATVCGFGAGRRWLERLGFRMETPCAEKWDGVNDYALFVRV